MADRLRVVLGAVMIQLVLGTVYGYSIFWQPLQAEVGLPQTQTNYAFAICILSFAVVMVIGGRVQDVLGPRLPAIVGGILLGAGFLIAGLMEHAVVFFLAHAAFTGAVAIVLLMLYHALFGGLDEQQVPVLRYVPLGIVAAVVTAGVVLSDQYVGRSEQIDRLFLLWGTVGFLAGAGIGFAYVCPIAALVKWFPRHKGLVSGIAVAGFGFGAYIFSHKHVPFSAENFIHSKGIVSLFLVHGVVAAVVVILGALLLRNPPGPAAATVSGGGASEQGWQETLRRPAFYVLWLMFFSGAMAGLMVIGILKPFAGTQLLAAAGGDAAIDEGARADLLARGVEAVGWLAMFNAIGRIIWGLVSDRVGRTAAFIAMFLLQAAMLATLGLMRSEFSLAVAASLIGFNFGGNFALFPSATADLFGAKNLGANYGWVFTAYGVAGVVGIAAGNFALQQTGSYAAGFLLASVLCIISAALAAGLGISHRRATVPT